MDSIDTRLKGLTLSWLLTQPKGRGTRKKLEEALWPLVEHRLRSGEWKEHHAAQVAALLRDGHVTEQGRSSLELTKEGREQALDFLGVKAPPQGLTWRSFKTKYLPALSLGLSPTRPVLDWVASADGVRAALLKRQHGVEGKETPTLKQVSDRLLWRQLGVETDRPFTLSAVQAHLLGQMLEVPVKEPKQGVKQLAARAAGSMRVEAEAVLLATQRRWLLPDSEALPPLAAAEPAPSAAPEPEPELRGEPAPIAEPPASPAASPAFAERVLEVARALPTEQRFGSNKVFIAHVWRALAPEWGNREAFNAALLEANRTRQLSLSRADLVAVMNPTDVAESEVNTSGASFHFVVV